MKMGGHRPASTGFTVIETMIVLAVTGLLFASTVLLILGRQNKAEFQTSLNNFQQQLQQVINETASGYFPGMGNFACNNDPTTYYGVVTFIKPTASANGQQGSNGGCIFLGKGVQFGLDTSSSRAAVYPFVGGQTTLDPATGAAVPAETTAQAYPRVAWPDDNPTSTATRPGCGDPISPSCGATADSATVNALKNLTVTDTMQYGLRIADKNHACAGAEIPTAAQNYNPPYRLKNPSGGTDLPDTTGGEPPICFLDPNPGTAYPAGLVETGMAIFLFGGANGTLASVNGGNVLAGSQSLGLYAVGPSPLNGTHSNSSGDNEGAVAGHLGNLPSFSYGTAGYADKSNLRAASKVLVCLASGSTDQSALITIGFNTTTTGLQGGGLGVTTKVMNDAICQ